MNDQMHPLIRLMHIFSLLDSYHNKSGLKLMIYDCETKKNFKVWNSDQTEFSLVTMISKRKKTLSERTLGRPCITRMRGFFCVRHV